MADALVQILEDGVTAMRLNDKPEGHLPDGEFVIVEYTDAVALFIMSDDGERKMSLKIAGEHKIYRPGRESGCYEASEARDDIDDEDVLHDDYENL